MSASNRSLLVVGSAFIGVVGLATVAGASCWRNGPMQCYSGGCTSGTIRICETDATDGHSTGTLATQTRPAVCEQLEGTYASPLLSRPCDWEADEGYQPVQPTMACTGTTGNCCWFKPGDVTRTYPPGDSIIAPLGLQQECDPPSQPE